MTQNGQMEKPSYYAIIPANVRYDEELGSTAKLLYGEITALCSKDGTCYARNAWFAKHFNVHPKTVGVLISKLVDRGYITRRMEFVDGTNNISKRYLEIVEQPIHNYVEGEEKSGEVRNKNVTPPTNKNRVLINTRINNTRFSKPTIDDLNNFKEEKQLKSDVDKFFNYHESKGWMVGKVKMKSWKKALLYWESNHKQWSDNGAKKQSVRSAYASSVYDYDKATDI